MVHGCKTDGDIPIFVWAAAENFHINVRQADGETLTFHPDGDSPIDEGTSSARDIGRGSATVGLLKDESLQPVTSLSSFD